MQIPLLLLFLFCYLISGVKKKSVLFLSFLYISFSFFLFNMIDSDMNRSLPTLRRSSFSTDSTDSFEDKPILMTQRSFPNLKSKTKKLDEEKYANDKRNQDFHVLFRSIPDQERLIEGRNR
jgi:hypothetical protein